MGGGGGSGAAISVLRAAIPAGLAMGHPLGSAHAAGESRIIMYLYHSFQCSGKIFVRSLVLLFNSALYSVQPPKPNAGPRQPRTELLFDLWCSHWKREISHAREGGA